MENINEHDKTKEMMNILRGESIQKLVMEDSKDDSYDVHPGSADYKSVYDQLKDHDSSIKITKFKVYPNDNNVILMGSYFSFDDTEKGVFFKMEKESTKPEVTTKDIDLDLSNQNVIRAIGGLFDKFRVDWNNNLPV